MDSLISKSMQLVGAASLETEMILISDPQVVTGLDSETNWRGNEERRHTRASKPCCGKYSGIL